MLAACCSRSRATTSRSSGFSSGCPQKLRRSPAVERVLSRGDGRRRAARIRHRPERRRRARGAGLSRLPPPAPSASRELFDPSDRRFRYPVHQLHQLRSPLHHRAPRPVRSPAHHHGRLRHVRARAARSTTTATTAAFTPSPTPVPTAALVRVSPMPPARPRHRTAATPWRRRRWRSIAARSWR